MKPRPAVFGVIAIWVGFVALLAVVPWTAAPDPDAATSADGDASVSPDKGEGGGKPDAEASGGDGEGGSPGSKKGNTTDRLLARAATQYNGRLAAFFRAGFRCPQLPEGAKKCSPTGSVTISSGLVVTSASFNACGVPEIDSAAQAVLMSKKGQQVPPPPAEYPQLQQAGHTIVYQCK